MDKNNFTQERFWLVQLWNIHRMKTVMEGQYKAHWANTEQAMLVWWRKCTFKTLSSKWPQDRNSTNKSQSAASGSALDTDCE